MSKRHITANPGQRAGFGAVVQLLNFIPAATAGRADDDRTVGSFTR
jgi:hypothetical protein